MRIGLTLSTWLAILSSACGEDANTGTDPQGLNGRDAEVVTEDQDSSATGLDAGSDAGEEDADAAALPDAQTPVPVEPDAGTDAGTSTPKPDAGTSTPKPDAGPPPPPTPPPPAPPPPAPESVKFSQVYAIIRERCAFCHTTGGIGLQLGHLDMSSAQVAHQNLVGRVADGIDCGGTGFLRVSPSAPDRSLILRKLMGTAECGVQMPDNYPPLSDEQIHVFRQWISAGAKND